MQIHFDPLHHLVDINKEMLEVYANISLQSMAMSMIGIFIPIYLLELGFPIMDVALFWIVMRIAMGLMFPVAIKVASFIGLKHAVILSVPLYVFIFTSLAFNFPLNIFILAIVFGAAKAMYYAPINTDLIANLDLKNMGKELGPLFSLPKFFSFLGPIVGAGIAYFFGFGALFAVAIFLMLLAVIPLFLSSDTKELKTPKMEKIIKHDKRFILDTAAHGFLIETGLFLWPLFVYYAVGSFVSLGFVVSIGALGTMLLPLWIAKHSDRKRNKRIFQVGAIMNAMFWIAIIFASADVHIFILAFIGGIAAMMRNMTFDKVVFDEIKKYDVVSGVWAREVGLTLGRLALLAVFVIMSFDFLNGFIAASLINLYWVFIRFR